MKYTEEQKQDARQKIKRIEEELELNYRNVDTWTSITYESLLCLKFQYKKILGLKEK